jgi:single-strand DNA-binding protein
MAYSDLNRVVLIGRLTRDPELRLLASGLNVCSLRVACNGARKEGEVYQERANFFDVTVFGRAGENVDRYMRKGNRLAIDGRLEWSEWETAEQQRRQAVNVVAESVQFLEAATGRSANGAGQQRIEDEQAGHDHTEHDQTELDRAEHDPGELVGVGAADAGDDLVF